MVRVFKNIFLNISSFCQSQLRQEKVHLEHTLEQEQECLVNKLMRRIEKLETETSAKQSNLETLRREKIELENTLEQEQEALVNKLWKRMDRLETEKRWEVKENNCCSDLIHKVVLLPFFQVPPSQIGPARVRAAQPAHNQRTQHRWYSGQSGQQHQCTPAGGPPPQAAAGDGQGGARAENGRLRQGGARDQGGEPEITEAAPTGAGASRGALSSPVRIRIKVRRKEQPLLTFAEVLALWWIFRSALFNHGSAFCSSLLALKWKRSESTTRWAVTLATSKAGPAPHLWFCPQEERVPGSLSPRGPALPVDPLPTWFTTTAQELCRVQFLRHR